MAVGAFEPHALESGVTKQLVRDVIRTFYGKIRNDVVLGPLFVSAIGTEWDTHIERIVRFWLTATRLERSYNGREFMRAHLKHQSIRLEHISRWLSIFQNTLAEHCSAAQLEALLDIALRMADNIALGIERRDRCKATGEIQDAARREGRREPRSS